MPIKKYTLLILVAILCGGAFAGLQAQSVWPTVKEWDTGDSNNRLDIVIMGDGYTAAQMPLFRTHVTNFINAWLAEVPLDDYRHHINIWRIEVESPQSGADKPMACFANPVMVNTELDASYCTGGTQRCLYCNTTKAHATAMMNVPSYDEVVVVVNDTTYGGCGGSVACYAGGNGSSLNIAIHELGHSVFGLADEYDYGSANPTYTGGQFGQPNVSNQDAAAMTAAQSKWHYWIGMSGVSAFEGAAYHEFGAWRPNSNCMMRSLGANFCPVCREEVIEDLWEYVTQYESVMPPAGPTILPYGTLLSVEVANVQHGAMAPEWLIDGVVAVGSGSSTSSGTTTTYTFDPSTVITPNSGQHTIAFRLTDATTWYQKVQPYRPLPNLSWTVSDTFVDFAVTSFALNTSPAHAGEVFLVDETIENLGATMSPTVRVGYYASNDALITTSDTLIEVRTLPPLAPGASVSLTKEVRAPSSLTGFSQTQYVGIIVDDLNALTETAENNNSAVTANLITYDNTDSLTTSTGIMVWDTAQTATLSIDAGMDYGGYGYIMAPARVGGLGQGSWLGPFVGFVDVTLDDLSDTVVNGVIGAPYFQNFSGTLDAFGQGQAQFFKPALPPSLPAGFIHFVVAYVTLDGGLLVAPRVSNKAEIFIF